ncbi:MAG: SDR family oxidoreductase [Rhodospirillaceae bacterium]|jgi:3-oxoacyl-[acyl-carrier protein] reductase|nr:SDR family oxidoreductase [Rhodospirillaceae bacterium]MBT4046391.1 SDR family oxidoreductase [Rhodospirillaceae bacterium]MBT4688264.1 SDR family oxidoreductase [Rhodospirillaceae bacterium]MBT5079257.1 SDR family oxidoreductase [Rhodospirillaceae bacterium]MBT5522459.1 SDR family oxidoreductase [Rhodospirillaceae bacterium]
MNTQPLLGRTALVTGGSGDIGSGIATLLASAGADVAITYMGHTAGADATLEAVAGHGRKGIAIQLDQRDPASIDACVQKMADGMGALDILVNNAAWNIGIAFPDLEALNGEIWDQVSETNLRGPYLLARAFATMLKSNEAGRIGHIVNIASAAGIAPGGSSIAYAASKAGLIHLTHCLAVAMAPDVAVNCVAPGLVEDTRMAQRVPDDMAQLIRQEAVLGRVGQIEDVAAQVLTFVASTSISGQVMTVDGGMPVAMR